MQQQQRQEELNRSLARRKSPYDYIDDNGYYVVDGVRVLPDDDSACNGSKEDMVPAPSPADAPYQREGILANVFGHGRSLLEDDVDHHLEKDQSQYLRTLKKGKMHGKGKTTFTADQVDDYYNYDSVGKGRKKMVRICQCELLVDYLAQ
jgi:hypothetical protein